MKNECLRLALVDPGLRKAPFFLEIRRHLGPRIECLYYSRRPIVRGYVRSAGAPLFPQGRAPVRADDGIDDAELRAAIGAKELALRPQRALARARRVLAGLAAFYDEQRVDAVLVWNGSNLVVSLAVHLARRRGLPVLFAEHGYLPGTLQLDPEGVNQMASITRLAASGGASLPPDPARDRALDEVIAAYRSGRPMRLPNAEIPAHLRRDWRSFLPRKLNVWLDTRYRRGQFSFPQSLRREHPERWPERYVLLPFQVCKDSQLVLHSPLVGNDMERLLACLQAALAEVDPGLRIVAKLHPCEHPLQQYRYQALRRRFPDVCFVGKGTVSRLVERAEAVVTVNSTVGFEALLCDRPVVALGRNFYVQDGLVECVHRLDELPQVLRRALQRPVDREARRAFLRYVQAHFLASGTYNDFSEPSLAAVADRLRDWLVRTLPERRAVQAAADAAGPATGGVTGAVSNAMAAPLAAGA